VRCFHRCTSTACTTPRAQAATDNRIEALEAMRRDIDEAEQQHAELEATAARLHAESAAAARAAVESAGYGDLARAQTAAPQMRKLLGGLRALDSDQVRCRVSNLRG
jgi:hypothetical protein